MISLNGANIRSLVYELPYHVFDFFCDEFAEMLLSQDKNITKRVHWEETYPNHNANAVAEDYGYEDFEDMSIQGDYIVVEFDEGVLIVE